MTKILLMPVLLALGCLIAGSYGALHNQISYTVASDYFHAFKFVQFRVPEHLQNRLGASLVGFHASWWMGMFIAIPLTIIGQMLPTPRAYFTRTLFAFGVVVLTALLTGLGALLYAQMTITVASLPAFHYPAGVTDPVVFARAGTMHNFTYMGGFLGILTGTAYLVIERIRGGGSAM